MRFFSILQCFNGVRLATSALLACLEFLVSLFPVTVKRPLVTKSLQRHINVMDVFIFLNIIRAYGLCGTSRV